MQRWKKTFGIGAAAVVILCASFFAVMAWKVADTIDTILTIGSPLAQGAGAPPAGRPADIGYIGDPSEAFGYTFDDLDMPGELGPTPAWLVRPAAQAGTRWAIFVHGIGGRRENGYRFLPVLHDAGLPTLMISYRGDPEAPASPDGRYALGLSEWRDLETGVQLALDRGASSVILVAESMGGGIVGQFLRHSSLASRVDALVLDAPLVDLPASIAAIIGRQGAPLPLLVAGLGIRLTDIRHSTDLRDAVVMPELANFPGPMFLSHGGGDRIVPVSTSDELAAARSGTVDYLRTEADHIQSWHEDPARYDSALRAFLTSLDPN